MLGRVGLIVSLAWLVGCGDDGKGGAAGGAAGSAGAAGSTGAAGTAGAATPANKMMFDTGEFEVPAGDSFTCFYTSTYTDRELSVGSASGSQGPGGHHILVFYTDAPRDPQYHPCNDAEMTSWHQIAGSAGQDMRGEVLGLPDGLALKVPAGKQLVIQAHYINTSAAAKKVHDTVTLNLVAAANVKSYVNYFVTNDDKFEVPAHATGYVSRTLCNVEQDLQVALTLGHMHEYGKHYQLEIIDANDQVLQTLRSDDWTEEFTSHPPITKYGMQQPLLLERGMRLRQTCTWDNTSDQPLLFPREMCLSFMYYFPGMGQDLDCKMTKL